MILLREYVKQVSVKSDEAIDRSTVVIWGNASRSYLPSEPTFLLSSTVRKETKIVAEASCFEFWDSNPIAKQGRDETSYLGTHRLWDFRDPNLSHMCLMYHILTMVLAILKGLSDNLLSSLDSHETRSIIGRHFWIWHVLPKWDFTYSIRANLSINVHGNSTFSGGIRWVV